MLAELCVQSDAAVKSQVVDVVLEHVLQDYSVRKCFKFWRGIPELGSLYDEGLDLANKWLDMRM